MTEGTGASEVEGFSDRLTHPEESAFNMQSGEVSQFSGSLEKSSDGELKKQYLQLGTKLLSPHCTSSPLTGGTGASVMTRGTGASGVGRAGEEGLTGGTGSCVERFCGRWTHLEESNIQSGDVLQFSGSTGGFASGFNMQ